MKKITWNFIVDCGSLIAMLGLIVTGSIIKFVLPPGSGGRGSAMHDGHGGEHIKRCFACGTCAAGCPVTNIDEEYNSRKIIRQVLFGMREEVLKSPLIWFCLTCYRFSARCDMSQVLVRRLGVGRPSAES